MKKVLFYQKDTPKNQIELWDIKLKKWHKSFKLVHLDDPEASEAIIALLWKAPMKKISKLKNLEAIISLGQGVDHIISNINFNKNILKLSSKLDVPIILEVRKLSGLAIDLST